MYGIVKIEGREVPMKATAATPIRFKGVFGEDLLKFFVEMQGQDKMNDFGIAEVMQKLGYIMKAQAAGEDFAKLTPETYLDWLDGFDDPMSVMMASGDIMSLYQTNAKTSSKPKKS